VARFRRRLSLGSKRGRKELKWLSSHNNKSKPKITPNSITPQNIPLENQDILTINAKIAAKVTKRTHKKIPEVEFFEGIFQPRTRDCSPGGK
jgi:hypothetical protein